MLWIIKLILLSSLLASNPPSDPTERIYELLDICHDLRIAGDYDSALIIYEEALKIAEEICDGRAEHCVLDDSVIIDILSDLGYAYNDYGDGNKAVEYMAKAWAIAQPHLNERNLRPLKVLRQLGSFSMGINRFDLAEECLIKYLWYIADCSEIKGHHLPHAQALLAKLYYNIGEYNKSMNYYELAYNNLINDIDSPTACSSVWIPYLNGIGNVYFALARYNEAEQYYKLCAYLRILLLGPEEAHLAENFNNLGNCRIIITNDYMEAIDYYKRALDLRKNKYGVDHFNLLYPLLNLGATYIRLDSFANAEYYLDWAQDICNKRFDKAHSLSIDCDLSFGHLCCARKEYDKAEELFLQALDSCRQLFGEESCKMADIYVTLSELNREKGDFVQAISFAQKACEINRSFFKDNAAILSEKDALSLSNNVLNSLDNYLTCHFDIEDNRPYTANAIELILFNKGQVADEIYERRRILKDSADPQILSIVDSIKRVKTEIQDLFIQPIWEDAIARNYALDSLERLANELDMRLSRKCAAYRQYRNYGELDLDRIASAMPNNSALIEFFRYYCSPTSSDSIIPYYIAAIITDAGEASLINLGEASYIESQITDYQTHMQILSTEWALAKEYAHHKYGEINAKLYKAIWEPIKEFANEKELLLISPDGMINMLSFASIIDADGRYLIEKYPILYLSAGRDLLRQKREIHDTEGMFAIGDPDFDAGVSDRVKGLQRIRDTAAAMGMFADRNVRSIGGNMNDLYFNGIPYTRNEILAIVQGYERSMGDKALICFDARASEDNFRLMAPKKKVIYVATHGFYLQDYSYLKYPERKLYAEYDYVGENPLLLSGLAFAGANRHGEMSDSADIEDGILTAYEVTTMDFAGTRLVVLSTCESGQGEIHRGEGVYGLRRAFQVAGAENIMCSLWPISDVHTARLMSGLYENELKNIARQIQSLQVKAIQESRAMGESDHPYTWAAFIVIGNWDN